MTLRRWLAVAALLAVPAWTWAQGVAQDGGSLVPKGTITSPPGAQLQGQLIGGILRSDSTLKLFTMTSAGAVVTSETSPIYDNNFTLASLINRDVTGLAIGAADSCVPQDTHKMRLGTLLIHAWIGGTGTADTTCTADVAVQIRTHLNSVDDSVSTYPIYQYGYAPMMNNTAALVSTPVADTSIVGHLYNAGNATSWSGEFVVHISAHRQGKGTGTVDVNGHTFSYPSGIGLPISSLYGRDIYSPSTSVRVRVLRIAKGAATFSTGTVNIKVGLLGSPL